MPSLPDLPAELMVQIMCQCPDIKTILRLSATCRQAQQTWRDNVAYIVSAIFSFTSEDLDEVLDLAKLEASVSAQPFLETKEDADLNDRVRCNLPSIERTGCCVTILRDQYAVEQAKQNHPTFHSVNCYIDVEPDVCKAYATIRRFAIGYDHQQVLPATYANMHESSDGELDSLWTVVFHLRNRCMDRWEQMGIQKHAGEGGNWLVDVEEDFYYLPLPWEFAHRTIDVESDFRFSGDELRNKETVYHRHHEHFGHARVERMYGAYKIPWTKLWWKIEELYREREAEYS